MSLELLPPDREPDADENDRLGERLEKLEACVEAMKEDLVDVCETLQALLDYLDIDRYEYELFKQTGSLRSYSRRVPGAREAEAARQSEEHRLEAEEKQVRRDQAIDEAVKKLDEIIVGIVALNPEYDNC
jgi:hypothetical protein